MGKIYNLNNKLIIDQKQYSRIGKIRSLSDLRPLEHLLADQLCMVSRKHS